MSGIGGAKDQHPAAEDGAIQQKFAAEKMLFFRPWGNKDPDAAPAPTRPGRAAFRQSPRAQGWSWAGRRRGLLSLF